jgi:hypothetical protein
MTELFCEPGLVHNRFMANLRKTWHGWAGLGILIAASTLSLAQVAWVRAWFYQFAWWGYILTVDGIIQARQGNSLIRDRGSTFWLMCLVSATFWFGWELVNLRLHNWHYIGVVEEAWLRWPGAFIAYATVLPGVLETYELLGVFGLRWGSKVRPLTQSVAWRPWFFALGIIMLALPLIWPGLFFPLVWGALIFLLEPLNHRLGAKSLMGFWQRGDLSPFVRLLLAGLVCGFLWESWNWLSEARWVYSIPYLSQPKLFAMPLAGFGGFPPFAVECYVFMASVNILRGNRGWELDDHGKTTRQPIPKWLGWALALAALAFDIWMLTQIDAHLVKG